MSNPHLQMELARQRQQRLQEQRPRLTEQRVQSQRRDPMRATIGRMMIAAGKRLVPTPSAHDEPMVTIAPAS